LWEQKSWKYVEPESFASLIKDEKERRRRFAQGVIIITQVTEESIKFSTLITRARVNTRKEIKGVMQANMAKWGTNKLLSAKPLSEVTQEHQR